MDDETILKKLSDIENHYHKGFPPKLSEYDRKQSGSIYLTDDELKSLVDANLVDVVRFENYKKIKLTEHGRDRLKSKRS